jgi:hypothetical protein
VSKTLHKLKKKFKFLFGDINVQIGQAGHDLHHLEVSRLLPINICGYGVNGVDGITLSPNAFEPIKGVFNTQPPKYNPEYDECRVAFHQWVLSSNLSSSLRLVWYFLFLNKEGENPFKVLRDHLNSY